MYKVHLAYKPDYFSKGLLLFTEMINHQEKNVKILTRLDYQDLHWSGLHSFEIESVPFILPTFNNKIISSEFISDFKDEEIGYVKIYIDCIKVNFDQSIIFLDFFIKNFNTSSSQLSLSFKFYFFLTRLILRKLAYKQGNFRFYEIDTKNDFYFAAHLSSKESLILAEYIPGFDLFNYEDKKLLFNSFTRNLCKSYFSRYYLKAGKSEKRWLDESLKKLLNLPLLTNDYNHLQEIRSEDLHPVITFTGNQIGEELPDYWNVDLVLKIGRKRISFEKIKNLKKDKEHYLKAYLFHLKRILALHPEFQKIIVENKNIETLELIDFLQHKALEIIKNKIVIQTPDFFSNLIKPKVKVWFKRASGNISSGMLAQDELLTFDWHLSVGKKALSEKEIMELLKSGKNLVKVGDNYMVINPDFLRKLLKKIKKEKDKFDEGVSIFEALNYQNEFMDDDDINIDSFYHSSLSLDKITKENFSIPKYIKGEKFNGKLRHYQEEGVRLISLLEKLKFGVILADDMGLGKTVQIIALITSELKNNTKGCNLIIAPATLLYNWEDEFKKFTKQFKIYTHYGPKRVADIKTLSDKKVILTSYGVVKKDITLFSQISFKRVIIDEAQNIKNINSEQTRVVKTLKSSSRIALTGTPIENRLLELWSIMDFCNQGLLHGHKYFISHFEIPIAKEETPKAKEKLKKIISPFIIRRMKTDKKIIRELPQRQESNIYLPLTEEQGALYDKIIKNVEEEFLASDGSSKKGVMLSAITRLKHACNHPILVKDYKSSNSKLKKRSSKLDRLTEMARTIESEGRKMLIFSQYVETLEMIKQHFDENLKKKTLLFHGGLTLKKRNTLVNDFERDEDISCMLLSIRAGGFGLNLTAANYVIHFDRWWNPAVENQAIDRVYRIGQTRKTFVYKFITRGTLEENIDKLINSKIDLSNSIISQSTPVLKDISSEDFLNLIRRN